MATIDLKFDYSNLQKFTFYDVTQEGQEISTNRFISGTSWYRRFGAMPAKWLMMLTDDQMLIWDASSKRLWIRGLYYTKSNQPTALRHVTTGVEEVLATNMKVFFIKPTALAVLDWIRDSVYYISGNKYTTVSLNTVFDANAYVGSIVPNRSFTPIVSGDGTIVHRPGFLKDKFGLWFVYAMNRSDDALICILGPFTEKTDYNNLSSYILTSPRIEAMGVNERSIVLKFEGDPKIYIKTDAWLNKEFTPEKAYYIDPTQLSGIHQTTGFDVPIDVNWKARSVGVNYDPATTTHNVAIVVENGGVLQFKFDAQWQLRSYKRLIANLSGRTASEYIATVLPFNTDACSEVRVTASELFVTSDVENAGGACVFSYSYDDTTQTLSHTLTATYRHATVVDSTGSPWLHNRAGEIQLSGTSYAVQGDGFIWVSTEPEEIPVPALDVVEIGSTTATVRVNVFQRSLVDTVSVYLKSSSDTDFVKVAEESVDNSVVTIQLRDLQPSTNYEVKAVSTSLGGQQKESPAITFQTQSPLSAVNFTLSRFEDTSAVLIELDEITDTRINRVEIWALRPGGTGSYERIGYLEPNKTFKLSKSGNVGSYELWFAPPLPFELMPGATIELVTTEQVDTDDDGVPDTTVEYKDSHRVVAVDYRTGAVKTETALSRVYGPDTTTARIQKLAYIDRATIGGLSYSYFLRFVTDVGEYVDSVPQVIYVDGEPHDFSTQLFQESWVADVNLKRLAEQSNGALQYNEDSGLSLVPSSTATQTKQVSYYLGLESAGVLYPSPSNFTRDNIGLRVAKLTGIYSTDKTVNRLLLFNELRNMVYDAKQVALKVVSGVDNNYGFTHENSFSLPTPVNVVEVEGDVTSPETVTIDLAWQSAYNFWTVTYNGQTETSLVAFRQSETRYRRYGAYFVHYYKPGTYTVTFLHPVDILSVDFGGASNVVTNVLYMDAAGGLIEAEADGTYRNVSVFQFEFVDKAYTSSVKFTTPVPFKLIITASGTEDVGGNVQPFSETTAVDVFTVSDSAKHFKTTLELNKNVLDYSLQVLFTIPDHIYNLMVERKLTRPIATVTGFDPGYAGETQTVAGKLVPYAVFDMQTPFIELYDIDINISVTNAVQGDEEIGYTMWAVSLDGGTKWWSYKDGSWLEVTPSQVSALGMTVDEVTSLTADNLNNLKNLVGKAVANLKLLCAFVTPMVSYSPYLHAVETQAHFRANYPESYEFELPVFRSSKLTKLYDIAFITETPVEPLSGLPTKAELYYSYSLDDGATWTEWTLWDGDRSKLEQIPFWEHPHRNLIRFKVRLESNTLTPIIRKVAVYYMDVDRVPRIIKPAPGEPIIDGKLDLIFLAPENLLGGTVQFAIEIARDPGFTNIIKKAKSFAENRAPFDASYSIETMYYCSNFIFGTDPNGYVWRPLGDGTPSYLGIPGINGAPADGRTYVRYQTTLTTTNVQTYYIRIYTWDGTVGGS